MRNSNMYDWIGATWNPLAGECEHRCTYCYVQSLRAKYPAMLRKYSLEPRLADPMPRIPPVSDKPIFVCDMTDLFAPGVRDVDINDILSLCCNSPGRQYLFQTKNPWRMGGWLTQMPRNRILCVTVETNAEYDFSKAPHPLDRMGAIGCIRQRPGGRKEILTITVEPIMRFWTLTFAPQLAALEPAWVSIGADSRGHGLPEPTAKEVEILVSDLRKRGIEVRIKANLKRIWPEAR